MREFDLAYSALRVALLAVPLALGACATKPTAPPAPTPAAAAAPGAAPAPQAAEAPTPQQAAELPAYLDPNNPLSQKRSLYFAFDDDTLNADDKAVAEMHGQWLAKHHDVHVRVEGNTDERGGSEYNLALGQRRAESVEKALEIYGVPASQMEAISYGKERPKAMGHDEQAWAQNRRADIVYPSH